MGFLDFLLPKKKTTTKVGQTPINLTSPNFSPVQPRPIGPMSPLNTTTPNFTSVNQPQLPVSQPKVTAPPPVQAPAPTPAPTGGMQVKRVGNDFFVIENGVERRLTSADPGSEFQRLGINEKFVQPGQTVSLEQAKTGQGVSGSVTPTTPTEPPKLAQEDYKSFYESVSGLTDVEKAQESQRAAEEQEQSLFDESQRQMGALITKSQELFDNFFNSPEIQASSEARAQAFTEMQRLDADEAAATANLKAAIRDKGTPSWAAAGQLRIVSESFAGERAKFAADYAIANDRLTEAKDFATQAYDNALTGLELRMGLIQGALDRATTLTERERADFTDTLALAKTAFDEKKADKDAAVELYLSLAQSGVGGITPDMSIAEMSAKASPALIEIANNARTLDQMEQRLRIAKTSADIQKVTAEIADLADRSEALLSEDIFDVLRASAGGKNPTDSFKNSFEKGVNVVFQLGDLQESIDNEALGPIMGIIRSKNPYDIKAQQIKAQLTAIIPNLARGIYGEVGVLTDNDVRLYAQTLPNLTSTEELSRALLGITIRSVQRSLETKLRVQAGAGVDVSGQEFVYKQVKDKADSLLGSGAPAGNDPADTPIGGTYTDETGASWLRRGQDEFEQISSGSR